MKISKVVVFLFAVCFMNHVQSMEPAQVDEFAVERQFLAERISPNDYLSYLASLSGEYAYKIRALRNAQSIDLQMLYEDFLGRLNNMPVMAGIILAHGNKERYDRMVRSARKHVIESIDAFYVELEKGVDVRYGRES